MKRVLVLALVMLASLGGSPPVVGAQAVGDTGASAVPWAVLSEIPPSRSPGVRSFIRPERFQALALNQSALIAGLSSVPMEPAPGLRPAGEGQVVSLPSPDGGFARFSVAESPIMEPGLAAKFPDIHTYSGQGIDDPAATVRFDVSNHGFHAQVLDPDGAWYIDPYYHLETSAYISYFKADLGANPHGEFTEDLLDDLDLSADATPPVAQRSGTQLRIHRAAFAADGEYTAFHGGTVAAGLAAIVTTLNRVNGIYENEVAVRMVLVANNNQLVYTNAATDPYANDTSDIDTNRSNVDAVIGSANYDIGHVFTTASGGVAYLGVVGVNGFKAGGTTGTSAPVNDPFVVDYVAHEVGHQYGGNHTFNGTNGACGGNANPSTAHEPGSGSTIQAYAGICGLDDLQLVGNGATGASDPYFHSVSFDEIVTHTTGGHPGDIGAVNTNNSVPTAAAGADGAIPASTPFLLRGSGTDANGDTLTYDWEQRDTGAQRALNNPQITAGPLFRSFAPTISPVRYLPRLATIAAGTTNVSGPCPALTGTMGPAQACWSEFLPTAARTMNFRVTVRDNRVGGGGVNTDDIVVTVANTGAPFSVTSQATATSYAGGTSQTVTWNVAGTTGAPIAAAGVDILLSTDGGLTFPTALSTNTPNDGTQSVVLPNTATSSARIMVVRTGAGTGVRFFNVNRANFTITATAPTGVSGTVTEAGSGSPVPGAFVAVLRSSDFSVAAGAVADGSGNYSAAVTPGSYYLYVIDPAGAHVAGFFGPPTSVPVVVGAMADADPQVASTRGAITGTVTDQATAAPIVGALAVTVGGTTGTPEIGATANPSGQFTVRGLRPGTHFVGYIDPAGAHRTEFHPHSPDVPNATSVAVTAGGSTTANGSLPAQAVWPGGAALTGTVTEAGTANPLAGVYVMALRAADYQIVRAATTNASGAYTLNVQAGGYKLAFFDSTGAHNMEWHNNQSPNALAAAATVTAPATTDAALGRNTGTMAGTIVDDPAATPVAGAWVIAIGANGVAAGAVTAANGNYTLAGLTPGTYRATFVDPNGGRTQEYWDDSPTYPGASTFNITAASTTTINAALRRP